MPVIKASVATASRAAPFSMADIEREAHAVIVQAKAQAARILGEAQRMGDQLKSQSKAIGFAEGKAEGFQEGLKDGTETGHRDALNEQREALVELVQTLANLCSDLDGSRRMLESEAVVDVMRLAVAIARKATKRLGAFDREVLSANVTEAVKLAVRVSDVRIAVAPSQKQLLQDILPQLRVQLPVLQHVELVPDNELSPGGCRVFTNSGVIDADLDQQIDRIAAELIPETANVREGEAPAEPGPALGSAGASPSQTSPAVST
jgi:flagellar assembly protein FliH